MNILFDLPTLLTGFLIFFARVADVSMGTMRTIFIVQGRSKLAFLLGFIEVSMWLVVISAVIHRIVDKPILGFFYALGFSTGNVVGILIEKRIAFGNIMLRIITPRAGKAMAEKVRNAGFGVTTFQGEGLSGAVTMLFVVCRRRDLSEVIQIAKGIDPDAFYATEQAGTVSKLYNPFIHPQTGWKAIFKRK